MNHRDSYGTVEIARMLGVSPATAVNWIRGGRIRAWRTPGGHRRVPRDELLGFVLRSGMPVPAELADRPRRILVVDDDPGIRELLADVISGAGIRGGVEVRTAADGPTGLMEIGLFQPEVLVLDIVLPGLNGFEVLRRVRAQQSWRPAVIAISGHRYGIRERALAAGADAFFEKPLDLDALVAMAAGPFREARP